MFVRKGDLTDQREYRCDKRLEVIEIVVTPEIRAVAMSDVMIIAAWVLRRT